GCGTARPVFSSRAAGELSFNIRRGRASLSGKRFAAIGFDDVEANRLRETLEQAHAILRIRYVVPDPSERWTDLYDAAIVNVSDELEGHVPPDYLATIDKPVVAVGLSSPKLEAALNAHAGEH